MTSVCFAVFSSFEIRRRDTVVMKTRSSSFFVIMGVLSLITLIYSLFAEGNGGYIKLLVQCYFILFENLDLLHIESIILLPQTNELLIASVYHAGWLVFSICNPSGSSILLPSTFQVYWISLNTILLLVADWSMLDRYFLVDA